MSVTIFGVGFGIVMQLWFISLALTRIAKALEAKR